MKKEMLLIGLGILLLADLSMNAYKFYNANVNAAFQQGAQTALAAVDKEIMSKDTLTWQHKDGSGAVTTVILEKKKK